MLAQQLDKRLSFLPYSLQIFLSKIRKRNPLRSFSKAGFRCESFLSDYVNDYKLTDSVSNDTYLKLFGTANASPSLQTKIDIQPTLFGAKPSQVSKKKGQPDSIYKDKDIKIFIYKWKSNDINIRYAVHFYKNQAFFINCSFMAPNAAKKKFIVDSLVQKYSINNTSDIETANHTLRDKNDNMVFIDDTISEFKVNYLHNQNAAWFSGMSNKMHMELNKQRAIEQLKEQWFVATI